MKKSSTRDWLIDSVIVIGCAGIAAFLLPFVEFLFGAYVFRLHGAGAVFWVQWVALEWLPSIIVGGLLGITVGSLIRHPKLSIACLPSVIVSVFYVVYLLFSRSAFSGLLSWIGLAIISGWLLLIAASLLCAQVILRGRQPNTY